MVGILEFPLVVYRNKFRLPPLPPPGSLQGKHILITGGNTGLGLHTALHCLNLGAASVIITSRDARKGEIAKQWLEEQTTNKSGVVKVMELEMSTTAGVVDFVKRLKKEVKVLDVVFLNAGVQNLKGPSNVSPEGWEISLQVNLLSTALLAILILPWLKTVSRGEGHLAFTGSGLHRARQITPASGWPQENIFEHWRDPANVKKVGGPGMMAVDKLLLQYVVREISQLALGPDDKPQVIVTSMCPGLVKTELGRDLMENPITGTLLTAAMTALFKSTSNGAITLVYGTVAPPEDNGKYFTHYQSDADYQAATQHNIFGPEGQKMQKQVWKELIELLGKQVPEVKEIVKQR